MHSHCLHGVDDGPEKIEQSIALCRSLVDDGITHVIATPHQLGSYDLRNSSDVIRRAVSELNLALQTQAIPLVIAAGGEVRIDDRLLTLLHTDQILTLADGHAFVLLELPHETLVDLSRAIAELKARGVTAIISHPERHDALRQRPESLARWTAAGAILQITAGSLLGQFGGITEHFAWQLVEGGQVALIASDAHDIANRPPSMTEAITALNTRVGHATTRRLCVQNPLHVFRGNCSAFPIRTPSARGAAKSRHWWERAR